MNVAARVGSTHDREAIAAIAEEVRAELAPLRGGAVLLARHGPSEPILPETGRPNAEPPEIAGVAGATFVGTIDDVAVGYAMVAIEVLHDGSRLGVIHEFAVLFGARGVGVGEAILDLVVAFCRERDCRGIDSFALPGTRETKNFFETFGFTARLLVVHSNLLASGGAPADSSPAATDAAPGE